MNRHIWIFALLLSHVVACGEKHEYTVPFPDAAIQDAQADSGTDATVDACNNSCTGATPVCNAATMQCVGCLASTDCGGVTPICDTTDNTCVECTVATEATVCSGNSCNPTTRECTNTPLASVGTCEPCVSDTECTQSGSTLRCVETSFNSTTHGTYCLAEAAGSCAAPYDNALSATSQGGTTAFFCFPPPEATCEAVLDYGNNCTADTDCGAPGTTDGLCRTTGVQDQCTYECAKNSHCSSVSCSTETTRYCCTGGAGAGCP